MIPFNVVGAASLPGARRYSGGGDRGFSVLQLSHGEPVGLRARVLSYLTDRHAVYAYDSYSNHDGYHYRSASLTQLA